LLAKSNACKKLEDWSAALACVESALSLEPGTPESQISRGNILRKLGRDEEALTAYDAALALDAAHVVAHYNRANAWLELKRFDEALAGFDRALALRADYPEAWNNRGNALLGMKRYEDAVDSFDRALQHRPAYASAWFNRGNALNALRRHDLAMQSFDQALRYDPAFADAHNGRGVVLASRQRLEEALLAYQQALDLRPDFPEALHNLGDCLMLLKRFDQAAARYEQALSLDAHNKYVEGAAYDCRHHGCDWSDHDAKSRSLVQGIQAQQPVCSPFVFLSVSDDPADQRACAAIFTQDRYAPAPQPVWTGERYGHHRIRVAYLSADFHSHATAYLMAELFELHDRQQFEWHAYSFGPERTGAMRQRLEKAFDHFTDVSDMSDLEIARRVRADEVDIAVDLKGFTLHCRPGIFAHRPAPVQVNYLGYPGTMAAPYMDYIIADATVIPREHERFYTEKVVRLPDTYQVNDRQRVVAPTPQHRRDHGLPDQGFVFCCFNNNYKITPRVFEVWMRLLRSVDGSVLWLLADNPQAVAHLRQAAASHGVDPGRLVFAGRQALPDHLARHRCADLFLDTLPYNAHTTTSDALWAGLPVLTCIGHAFAGRVAASLLKAAGVPELITPDLQAYEQAALSWATQPARLAAVRQKLAQQRLTAPLFDTQRFCGHMEQAFKHMHQRCE
jgi:protein O-GlcNAc transferase